MPIGPPTLLVGIKIPWPNTTRLPLVLSLGSWSIFGLLVPVRHRSRLFKTSIAAGMNELLHKKAWHNLFYTPLYAPTACGVCFVCILTSLHHTIRTYTSPPTYFKYMSMHSHSANIYTYVNVAISRKVPC